MPFDSLFRREADLEQLENDFTREIIHTKMLEVHEKLDLYANEAWRNLAAMLQVDADAAYRDVMNAPTGEPLALARERAKTYARILGRPAALENELAGLRAQLAEIEESEDG